MKHHCLSHILMKQKVNEALTELKKQYRGGVIVTHIVEQW